MSFRKRIHTHNTSESTIQGTLDQINMRADSVAKAIALPFCTRMVQILIDNNCLEDVRSEHFMHLVNRRLSANRGVYLFKGEKIGSTSNFILRFQVYKKKSDDKKEKLAQVEFCIIVDLDILNAETERQILDVYNQFMGVMGTSQKLHPFQRHFFQALHKRGGECLGPKKEIVTQMIELGLQKMLNLWTGAMGEFLAFDSKTYNAWFDKASNDSRPFIDELEDMEIPGYGTNQCRVFSICSWKPNHDRLSSNIVCAEAMVGQGNYKNAIDYPAIPGSTRSNDIFNSKNYTKDDREMGRADVIIPILQDLKSTGGVFDFDTCDVVFGDDPNFDADAHDILLQLGFELKRSLVVDGSVEVRKYDFGRTASVILRRPYCLASRSDKTRAWLRILRGLTVATNLNIFRSCRGLAPFSPEDSFENPVHAMMAFQLVFMGLHQHLKTCAAFYREFMTPVDVFALINNGLPKHDMDPLYPIAQLQLSKIWGNNNLLQKCHVDDFTDEIGRENCPIIIREARCLITRMPNGLEDEAKVAWLADALTTLFQQDDPSCSKMLARWKLLFAQAPEEYPLHLLLLQARKSMTQNSGNPNARKAPTAQIRNNDDLIEYMIANETPCWLPFDVPTKQQDLSIFPAASDCGHKPFPGNQYPLIQFAYSSLLERFKNKKTKNNTKAVKSKKYPHLSLKAVTANGKPPKSGNPGIKVTCGDFKYVLGQIVPSETSNSKRRK